MKKLLLIIGIIVTLYTTMFGKTTYSSYKDDVTHIVQCNTGIYSDDNCGIASLKMALSFMRIGAPSVEHLRQIVNPYSGWIYTNQIEDYLDSREVDYNIVSINEKETIINYLDDGILLLCLDMSKVSGKSYNNSTGHFIVVVGYYMTNDDCWLEVFDPLNYEERYYKLRDVFNSVSYWWGYGFYFEAIDESINEKIRE